jgi:hypothetical protein
MSLPRKALSIFIILCFIFTAVIGSSSAAENRAKLDVVFVLDASGSMRESDPDRITADAVKMMVSMMPAGDCRVGVVSFNIEPKVRTKDSEGNNALISLGTPEDTEYIKNRLDQIEYMDDTGIGNALLKASEMLDALSGSDSRKAIILFTDGMDDLEDSSAMQDCLENEQKAVEWAKENNCPIYCIGLDYKGAGGVSSLGENGEGIQKLMGIAEPTGGFANATSDIRKIEELFIDILANIFSIYYNEAEFVSGDGNREAVIKINPNVNEANIRISGKNARGLEMEQIGLCDPDGNPVSFENGAGIRFDSDKMSSNIKIALPKAGEWKLVLNGEGGADLRIGHLEHYYLDIQSSVEFSGQDPNVLHPNEEAVITACLTSDGEPVTDSEVNDAVITAVAHVADVSDPGKAFDVELVRRDASFVGSFTPEIAGEYNVEVTLGTNSFYRTESISVKCEGLPAAETLSIVRGFPDIELDAGGQASIENILSHIENGQGDIKVTAALQDGLDAAKIAYDPASDVLTVEGLAGGETAAKITFSDPSGNTESVVFRIKVLEPEIEPQQPKPAFDPIILLYVAAAAAAVCIAAYRFYNKRNLEFKGYILMHGISYRSGDASTAITASYNEFGDIREDFVFSAGLFSDKKDRDLASLLFEAAEKLEDSRENDQRAVYGFLTSETGQKMLRAAKKVRLEGTLKGNKGLYFIASAGNRFVFINGKTTGRFNLDVGSNLEVMILSDPGMNGGTSLALELEYKKIMRHWTRTFVAPED